MSEVVVFGAVALSLTAHALPRAELAGAAQEAASPEQPESAPEAASDPPEAPITGPRYSEEADTITTLWIEGGAAGWWTERAPLPSVAPLVLGVGLGYEIEGVRLAWRARVHLAPGEAQRLAFVVGDFFGFERIYGEGRLRPWWRLAAGFALDLVGQSRSLGAVGYFNADNGPSGGFSVSHAWGVDIGLTDRLALRLEGEARVYGGAGRSGGMGGGHLGLARSF